eukprot:9377930-Alexandrium_andersonii.AAC.1
MFGAQAILVHCKCQQGSGGRMPELPRASVLELLQARPGGAAAEAGEPQGTPERCESQAGDAPGQP